MRPLRLGGVRGVIPLALASTDERVVVELVDLQYTELRHQHTPDL